jgi:hypothetical protein
MKPHSVYHLVSALAIVAVALIAAYGPQADSAGADRTAADARQAFTSFMPDAPLTR